MVTWDIVPFEGLGPLRFGMARTEIRTLLPYRYREFAKVIGTSQTTDAYDDPGLHLYYDDGNQLEFIEAFEPADPVFEGIHVLSPDRGAVLEQLKGLGYHARYDDGGYFLDNLGFTLYAPGETIEAVSVFRKGYYS